MDSNKKIQQNKKFNELSSEEKILRRTTEYKVPGNISTEEALWLVKTKIANSAKSSVQPPKKERTLIYWFSASAAFMLLLFGIWQLWIYKPETEIVAMKGQHTEYKLPDGSQVTINADSKIAYNTKNYINNRSISLDGEAFFNVSKGSTFTIKTKQAKIQVLGTSFNVYARDNYFKVSCFTGKIQVSNKNSSELIIPGESAVVTNDKVVKFKDKNYSTSANWRIGEFNFEDAPLNSVFKEIERQFNVKFASLKFSNKYFTGGFTNKNLVETLDIVCIPMGLTYEIGSNSKIIVREKP